MRRLLCLLALASTAALACRNEDVPPPDVYFDPNGRGQLPDGSVVADASADVNSADVNSADVVTADASAAEASTTDASTDVSSADASTD